MPTEKGNNAEIQRPIYNPISNVESLENYVPGGYHPVMVGDVLHDRYRVVDKLGFGGYSTVWLAQDTQLKCYVAVKVDIHLRNVLVCLQSRLNELSIDELYKQYGEPETIPVTRCDGKPLLPNVPKAVFAPLNLADGKRADEFTLADTRVLLSDFGEVYIPKLAPRLGRDCHTPLGSRPPESRFEPDAPLSYPADIWSLGITIWEILGMKAIFSSEFTTLDEVTAQQVDVLGPMPSSWWERWDERTQFFDDISILDEDFDLLKDFHCAAGSGTGVSAVEKRDDAHMW